MEISELPFLPPEVWVLVFSYLNTEEKHTVRLCCTDFRDLIDHPSLWRGYTVVLSNVPRYTSGFWDTLKYRRITRVAVQHLQPEDLQCLVETLPLVTTIVCMKGRWQYKKDLANLSEFPNLKSLGIRNATWDGPMLGQSQTEHLVKRLTHLSVCNVEMPNTVEFINSVSRMVNLQYLLFHLQDDGGLDTVKSVPCNVFHNLLLNLKKLKHLSWGMKGEPPESLPNNYFYPLDPENPGVYGGPGLTTLELVNYSEILLTENALRGLTSLKSLSVQYRYPWDGIQCNLRSWLNHLQQLESLTVIGGNFLASSTTNFPPRVTRLTLRTSICTCQMDSIASRVKGVEHLDMDHNSFAGNLCKRLPVLFPQLKTLRIRFYREEPRRDLLSLNKLQHLERLELIKRRSYIHKCDRKGQPWPNPRLQGLIKELQDLSKNRFTIITTLRQRNLFQECDCVWEREGAES